MEAVSAAEERGLTPAESVCVGIGVLKAMIRDLGPDAERVARFAAMEYGLLAEGRSESPQALH